MPAPASIFCLQSICWHRSFPALSLSSRAGMPISIYCSNSRLHKWVNEYWWRFSSLSNDSSNKTGCSQPEVPMRNNDGDQVFALKTMRISVSGCGWSSSDGTLARRLGQVQEEALRKSRSTTIPSPAYSPIHSTSPSDSSKGHRFRPQLVSGGGFFLCPSRSERDVESWIKGPEKIYSKIRLNKVIRYRNY